MTGGKGGTEFVLHNLMDGIVVFAPSADTVVQVDSGAATTHGNLNRIRAVFDIINKRSDPTTWNDDTLGHGSHCAGVIGAADPSWGIRGFAPDAEIHVCKLFPGGQISQLIEALEYCIEHQIAVVNLSLGGTGGHQHHQQDSE